MHQSAFLAVHMGDSEFCNYGWRLASEHPATAVRFARGRKMKTVGGLFDEISAACQFPYYFGENWPAFAECLGDLDWMNASRFVLLITEFEQIMADEPDQIGALGRSLRSAIREYNRERANPEFKESVFQLIINYRVADKQFKSPIFDEIGSPLLLRL